ncbi:MAG: ATP-dependent protease [Ilumatobacter sp.]|nr:ATP-dependent protease [Ilumatobacter sp.]
MAVMPMFPLGTVLLPGAVLPLHVFEDRYRQMFRELLADDANPLEFGVALITRGRDAGGGDERAMVATAARVLDMQVTDDGRYVLAAVGTDRLRVNAWLPDDPYPIADVDVWVDDDRRALDDRSDDLDELMARIGEAHRRVDEINELAAQLGEATPPPTEISDDPVLAAYHLGSLAPIGSADRFKLLDAPGLGARLDVLDAALDDAAAVLEFRRS